MFSIDLFCLIVHILCTIIGHNGKILTCTMSKLTIVRRLSPLDNGVKWNKTVIFVVLAKIFTQIFYLLRKPKTNKIDWYTFAASMNLVAKKRQPASYNFIVLVEVFRCACIATLRALFCRKKQFRPKQMYISELSQLLLNRKLMRSSNAS